MKGMDAIPLTDIRRASEDNVDCSINHSFSQNSISSSNSAGGNSDFLRSQPSERRPVRSFRVNSTYISKHRFSRYKNALGTFIPIRPFNTKDDSVELPLDSYGCFSNLSFLWIRKFLIKQSDKNVASCLESLEHRKKYKVPNTVLSDRADINGKRFLGIYKDEKQMRGKKKGSMLRVAWNFCRTRVIFASLFHTLSTIFGLLGPVLFLTYTLDFLENETLLANETNSTNVNETSSMNQMRIFKLLEFQLNFYGRFNCIYLMIGFMLCYFTSILLKCVTNWINLRTAIRLRTGIIGATYKKVMKSSIKNQISPSQILFLANDESEIILALVDNGSKIIGTIFGVLICLISSVVLLHLPGLWPLLGVLGFFFLQILLSKISTNRFRKSLHFFFKKITIVEDFCLNFKDILINNFTYNYIKNFYYNSNHQFAALRWSQIFSHQFYGAMTSSVLLGGLYLIWCDVDIVTNNVEILVLMVVYIHFIKNLILEYCDSIEAIFHGKCCLEKLKNSFALSTPEPSKNRTIDTRVLLSMNSARYRKIDDTEEQGQEPVTFNMDICRGDVIGINGQNSKVFIHALLGHCEFINGLVRQRGKIAYFPEEPFISMGSLKTNIIMGSEFDAKRYYKAVAAVKLNEDILMTMGADDLPIETLNLNRQQCERIQLARAIYAKSDLYIFDQPFKNAIFSSTVLQIFASVIDNISTDPNKAILINSSNNQILNICKKVYDVDNNQIYSSIEYERVSAVSYREISKNYTFDCIKGCKENSLTPYKLPHRFHVQIIHENNNLPVDSVEELNEPFIKKPIEKNFTLSKFNLSVITILTVINTLIYLSLAFGFIMVVKKEYIEPWLNLVCLGFFITCFFVDFIKKVYMAKVIEIRLKKLHKIIFEKLLHASLDYFVSTNIADILNWFSTTFSSEFTPYLVIIKSLSIIIVSVILAVLINYWITVGVALILILGQIFSIHYIFKNRIKLSLKYYYLVEYESKKKLFSFVINNLKGRAVIQAFDRNREFCAEFNSILEENSTAIFLQKSIKYYVSFILQFFLGLTFSIIYIFTLIIGELSIYNYLLSILIYYFLMYYTNELIVNGFLESIIAKSKVKMLDMEIATIPHNKQVNLLHEKLNHSNTGLSITFKNLIIKLSGRTVLDIKHLEIEKGDIIGFRGKGSNLIMPLLYKVLTQSVGTISFDGIELNLIGQDNLHNLISSIPYDVHIDASIIEFINPTNSLPHKSILNKLNQLLPNLFKNPEKLNLKLKKLSRKERQLLCLVKASLKKGMILIIEFPHPEIQDQINLHIKRDFYQRTVIVIGCAHQHFEPCNRLIDFDSTQFSKS